VRSTRYGLAALRAVAAFGVAACGSNSATSGPAQTASDGRRLDRRLSAERPGGHARRRQTSRSCAASPTRSRSCKSARIVEQAPVEELFSTPRHPYTRALIGAIAPADGGGVLPEALAGEVPDPAAPPQGCHFRPRCPHAFGRCAERPELRSISPAARVACWLDPLENT
jgi:oligopeptide/dipeptide ABC transporter ATP-binding protein